MRKSSILLESKAVSVLLQKNGLDVKEVDVTPYQANCLPLPTLNEAASYLGTGTVENRRDLKSEADDLVISYACRSRIEPQNLSSWSVL
jgi:hypothetical protein